MLNCNNLNHAKETRNSTVALSCRRPAKLCGGEKPAHALGRYSHVGLVTCGI